MKGFTVVTTSLFDRLLVKLTQQQPELPEIFGEAVDVLKQDPYNVSRSHAIRKLRNVKPGEGQHRLRVGQWRFRYDIWDKRHEVELSYCGLRREDTYR